MTDLIELHRRHCIALALAAAAWGCGAPALARTAEAARILVVGDSLSAEYGLKRDAGWVKLLEQRLAERRLPATVINASISGDTTSGGRSRLPALLQQHQPTHVVIELGANDALRGLPLKTTADNLGEMARASRAIGAKVLIVGMQLPPNYGRRYGEEFAGLFKQVAAEHKAALVPFFFKGVADVPDAMRLFQTDRIHPNEEAQPRLLDNVWPVLEPLLKARR
ncbi:MAG: arylesterase [Aquabacterium sp.]|nr:arylesterase [Aquabacterium sp.]